MKNLSLSITVLCLSIMTGFGQITVPAPSPKAVISQTVGLTNITIDYSSPAVRDRVIFGDLVPYNELWRTGANLSTDITFDNNVTIGGKDLKKGTYSFLTIPGKDKWILIFNKVPKLRGTGGYDEANDAIRIEVKPSVCKKTERMTFSFSDFTNEKTMINLSWATTRVSFEVKVNTDEMVMAKINEALHPTLANYQRAARYSRESGMHTKKGEAWAKKAVQLDGKYWYNHYQYAALLMMNNKNRAALAYAKKAWNLGEKAAKNGQNFFYRDRIEKMIDTLKNK